MHEVSRRWMAVVAFVALLAVPLAGMALNVGGADLVKKGTGTRKLAMLPVYNATLFVPQALASAAEREVIAADEPMAVVFKVESRLVSTDLFISSMEKGFKNSASAGYPTDKFAQYKSLYNGIVFKKGAVVQHLYDPKKGMTVVYTSPEGASKVLGTLSGLTMKKAFFAILIGPKPPTAELKQGMLGK